MAVAAIAMGIDPAVGTIPDSDPGRYHVPERGPDGLFNERHDADIGTDGQQRGSDVGFPHQRLLGGGRSGRIG